jgi:hypothetical protein
MCEVPNRTSTTIRVQRGRILCGVTVVSQWCYRGVTAVVQWGHRVAIKVLQRC